MLRTARRHESRAALSRALRCEGADGAFRSAPEESRAEVNAPGEAQTQAAGKEILPAARYIDIPWNGTFNGNYQISAVVSTVVGNSATSQTLLSSVTVDREDLLITGTSPANPTPLLWDPTNPNLPNPAPITATFTAAYKASGTATLKIYHSYDNVNPVQTLSKAFLTTDGQVALSWNGLTNTPDGNGGDLPADPGVYLFQWNLSDTTGSSDSDKSSFPGQSAGLQIPAPPSPTAVLDKTDLTMKSYLVSYNSLSLDNPTRPASSGQIDAFDVNLVDQATKTLAVGDLTPGVHTVQVIIPQDDDYTFLVSLLDGDADKDKGHRQRYALQHNQTVPGVRRGALFGSNNIAAQTVADVWDYLHNQGFWNNNLRDGCVAPAVQLTFTPNFSFAFDEPRMDCVAAQAWYALKWSGKAKGPLYWFFLGHGSSGNALQFASNTWLVSDRGTDKASNVGARSYVEDFAPQELANVRICVLAACTSGKKSVASKDSSIIATMMRSKGVQNTINFNQHVPEFVASLWSESFWKYVTQGNTPGNKNAIEYPTAASIAQDEIISSNKVQFLISHNNYSFVDYNGTTIGSTMDQNNQ